MKYKLIQQVVAEEEITPQGSQTSQVKRVVLAEAASDIDEPNLKQRIATVVQAGMR